MRLVWYVALAITASATALASDDANWTQCTSGSTFHAKEVIAGCTSIIDDKGQAKGRLAVAHTLRASALSTQRKFEKALDDFAIALRMEPKASSTYILRGLAYFEMKAFGKAIADYTKAIALEPNHANAYDSRGAVYARLGDRARAIADFTRAIDIGPARSDQYRDRGALLAEQKKFEAAIGDFSRALALKPDDVMTLNDRCFARAAANKDLKDALSDCDKALSFKPKGKTHDSRGFVYLRMGEFKKAIEDFDAALEADAKAAGSLFKRGIAKLRSGDRAGGNADIASAQALDPHVAEEMAGYGLTP